MNKWPITIALPQGLTVGGVTTWAIRLAAGLADLGRDVRLIAHDGCQATGQREIAASQLPGRVKVVRAPAIGDPLNWRSCVGAYRDMMPTVLLPNILAESYAAAAALAAGGGDGLRVVAWNHSDNPYDYAYLSYYEPIIHRYAAVSRRCQSELANRLPTRSDDVELLPYGVSVPPEVRRPPLSGRAVRLIYAGRMEQLTKQVLDLVKLASILDRRGTWFEMRLVGDGPQSAELDRNIAEANRRFSHRRNMIRREAAVPPDEMPEVWSWADVSLLLSVHEGLSFAMTEPMAFGCVPVVSRVASGVDDVIKEGENGLRFCVGDLEAAAVHIVRLTENETEMLRMSRAARESIDEHCNFQRYFDRAVEIIDGAAACEDRYWPPDRPLRMNAGAADFGSGVSPVSFSGTVPGDAAERLARVLARVDRVGGGPVAIYGAGGHTRALSQVLAASPVEIVAVIDDDPSRHGDKLWGWPIVGPAEAATVGARAVVISSWMHESAIWQQRHVLEAAGLRVHRIYGQDEKEAVRCQSTRLAAADPAHYLNPG